ncbi:unnamed protein product [Caenorhabditis auriculariae]|uniref:Globin domain-containing protein n=1 Tax=Caenorhabditis auriculariae TaxID=2777116 RepID=A0A8S1GUG4_9PELO|nr:unnamed protein product [Caenorhabditis auriculariae]
MYRKMLRSHENEPDLENRKKSLKNRSLSREARNRQISDSESENLPKSGPTSSKPLAKSHNVEKSEFFFLLFRILSNLTSLLVLLVDYLKLNLEISNSDNEISRETNRLSESQRVLIQKTFLNIEKDPVRNGLKIFVRLFSEYPNYKLVWPQFRAIPDSSLMNAIELRRHASVYMCGLRQIIDSMGNEEELAAQLSRIALAHIKWNVQRYHVVNMCEPVCEVVKECNDYKMDAETRKAWTVLYQVIANLIEVFRARAK